MNTLELQLGAELTASSKVSQFGAAPNESVAVLALLLAQSKNAPVPRKSIASLLFPSGTSSNSLQAVRQCIFRLRRWLGDDWVKTTAQHVQAVGDWTLEMVPMDQLTAPCRYTHQFIQQLVAAPKVDRSSILESFQQSVIQTSEIHLDSARAILISTPTLAHSLHTGDLFRLLHRVRPQTRSDPFAFEFCEMCAWLCLHRGQFLESEDWLRRAGRIAHHSGGLTERTRTLSLLLFLMIEKGDRGSSESLLSDLTRPAAKAGLLAEAAKVAYWWNFGQMDDALELIKGHWGKVRGGSARDRLHFWSNCSVLGAECGDHDFVWRALEQCEGLLVPGLQIEPRANMQFARHLIAARNQKLQAGSELEKVAEELAQFGRPIMSLYALEFAAVAHTFLGNNVSARSCWRKAETGRKQIGARVTPRIIMWRRVVFKT